MAVYKSKKSTKDGRQYFFRIKYKDIFGETHDYSSPKFKTRKEAVDEEARYRIRVQVKDPELSIKNYSLKVVFDNYIIYKESKVKKQTLIKIKEQFKHLEILYDIRINNITTKEYDKFYKNLNQKPFSISHKNKILNLFKQLIIYSNKKYHTSNTILDSVEKFEDKNAIKKEMKFFTYVLIFKLFSTNN